MLKLDHSSGENDSHTSLAMRKERKKTSLNPATSLNQSTDSIKRDLLEGINTAKVEDLTKPVTLVDLMQEKSAANKNFLPSADERPTTQQNKKNKGGQFRFSLSILNDIAKPSREALKKPDYSTKLEDVPPLADFII